MLVFADKDFKVLTINMCNNSKISWLKWINRWGIIRGTQKQ